MSLVRISNVSAKYSKENVIENISFEINASELVGVLGVNGSGKSTLFKAISNILKHEGKVFIKDQEIEKLTISSVSKLISYIPQKSGISIDISVLDVVKMGFNPRLNIFEKPDTQMENEAKFVLDLLGIADKAYDNFMMLSEGQKQLTILARSLVSNGVLLVMDEPESALDFNVRINTINIIKNWIKNKEQAGLIILHDVMLALNYCDKLILLKDKQKVATIDLHNDSVEEIEDKLRLIYKDISISLVKNKQGMDNLIMLYEAEAT